jgi:hypothetical protein
VLYDAAMNRGRLMVLFALALTGCAFSGSEGDGDGTGSGDGSGTGSGSGSGSGVKPDEPPRCTFTYVDVCGFKPVPPAMMYTGTTTIDTSVDASCPHIITQGEGEPELCVFHGASLTIAQGAVVKATGTRPLVFVTSGAMTIAGHLDVSSTRQNGSTVEWVGAAGAETACTASPRSPGNSNNGGGAGAGASFSGKGGTGGRGGSNSTGGEAPASLSFASIGYIRGGCRGQGGGDSAGSANGEPPGVGGPGGGALYLAASGEITIESTGRITANGGGGSGGGSLSGGGGGGSGGMILLEAKATHRAGLVTASGGGAGQGGVWVASGPFAGKYTGQSGEDINASGGAARGGNFPLIPGQGGNGTAGDQRSGANGANGANNNSGGGGGGGAAGFIRILGASDGAGVIAPPLSN